MKDIINIEGYLKEVSKYDSYKNVMYRGQTDNKFKNISASINRDDGYINNEHFIIAEILNKKSYDFKELNLPIEQLSKMQHYGFPTRLIDITSDPLIALYFAVENTENLSDGEVFVFIKNTYDLNSKQANVVSLLSNIKSYDIDYIKEKYEEVYNEQINSDEILEYAGENIYITGTERLKETNERLFNQKGSFIVCGNKILDNRVTNKLLDINKDEAHQVIRIPFEYKRIIKDTLDEKFAINEGFIYPELQSFANYIKSKYKNNNIDLTDAYEIEKSEDSSTPGARRRGVYIVLKKRLNIYQIKKIVKSVIDEIKIGLDVIWIYVASNSNDLIMCNWIVRAMWIREELDSSWKPNHLKELDGQGISWEMSSSFVSLNNYYEKNVFEDDKKLFVYNDKAFNKIKIIYNKLKEEFKNNNLHEFKVIVKSYENEIKDIYIIMGNFGHSRKREFDKFLHLYQELICQLDNIPVYLCNRELKEKTDAYMINMYFEGIDNIIKKIEFRRDSWRKELNISDEEYKQINYVKKEKDYNLFKPTIPINKNGLNVEFNISINKLEDNKVEIIGKTNLFNKASLLLTIKNSNSYMGQDKVTVENGQFKSAIFSNKGNSLEAGRYILNISLSFPGTQSKEFIDNAGIEYENLIGDFINRDGIGPTGELIYYFEI